MNLPKQPKKGDPVIHFAKEAINWMRANTLNHVKGGRLKRSTNGTTVEVIETQVPNLDDILAAVTHPWKVTSGVSGSVNVAAGYVMGYYTTYTEDQWGYLTPGLVAAGGDDSADSIVLAAGFYQGGTSVAITDTKFIYAEVDRTAPPLVYSESAGETLEDIIEVELGDQGRPPNYDTETLDVAGTAVIVASADPPHVYTPTSNFAAVCIARVVNTEGVMSITQYLTHNPTIFIPTVKVVAGTL